MVDLSEYQSDVSITFNKYFGKDYANNTKFLTFRLLSAVLQLCEINGLNKKQVNSIYQIAYSNIESLEIKDTESDILGWIIFNLFALSNAMNYNLNDLAQKELKLYKRILKVQKQ